MIAASVSAPEEFGNPQTGIVHDNVSPRPGSQAGFRLDDFGNVFLTPDNNVLNLTYFFMQGNINIPTLLFEVTFDAGDPVVLSGELFKDSSAAIPIPASMPLLVSGIAGLAGFSRRQRRKKHCV
jgi:hypothetical protein